MPINTKEIRLTFDHCDAALISRCHTSMDTSAPQGAEIIEHSRIDSEDKKSSVLVLRMRTAKHATKFKNWMKREGKHIHARFNKVEAKPAIAA